LVEELFFLLDVSHWSKDLLVELIHVESEYFESISLVLFTLDLEVGVNEVLKVFSEGIDVFD